MAKLSKKSQAILQRAHDQLKRKNGWMQGGLGDVADPDAKHCALGAVIASALELGVIDEPVHFVSYVGPKSLADAVRALHKRVQADGYPSLVWFNDGTKTRKKDVIALFEKTLEEATI